MTIRLVPAKEGLVAAAAALLDPRGKDYSRHWVCFPERRPAYYLRKALAAREGSAFIPPRIDSFDAFIDRLYAEGLGRRDRLIDSLDAVAVLFEIHNGAPAKMGGRHFLTADQFFPLGSKLFRDLEELRAADAAPEAIRRLDTWAEEAVPEKTRERLQSLSYFYETFYGELETRGLSTRASRLRAAAAGVPPDALRGIDRLIFAGFFSLAKAEAALIRALLEMETFELLLLEGQGLLTVLDRLEIADPGLRAAAMAVERQGPLAPGGPRISIIKSPDTHGQVFALNSELKPLLDDRSRIDERRVIVLPASETLFPLYQQTLSALGTDEYNISMGYPVARTPIYSFFDKLLELLQSADEEGRFYAPHYLRLVLHPYAKNIYYQAEGRRGGDRRSDLTRILFHAIEEEMTSRRARTFWSLEEIETDEGIREAVQDLCRNVEGAPPPAALQEHLRRIHAALIAPFRSLRDVGDFAAKLAAALDFIYAHSTARRHTFFHPFAEAFLGLLDGLGRSLLRDTVFADKDSYYNLFRKVAQGGTVPFEGTPLRGLQVLGFWETRCIPFEDVVILDLNEDVLPASRREDSLLPFGARLALGLPTYRDNETRVEYYLDTILRGAGTARLFFVENNDKERSRYVDRIIWDMQKRDREKRPGRYVRTVQYAVALRTDEPEAVEKTAEASAFLKDFRYSATALNAYLQCPLQFYYGYVLRLREKEELGERMERRDIGSFVHSILEEYFAPWIGKRMRPADLRIKAMDELVARRFRDTFGRDLAGSVYLMKLQTERQLRAFVTDYQIPLIAGLEAEGRELRLVGLEKSVETTWPVKAGTAGREFKLAAKIDRAETRGDEVFVLDYKTSASTTFLGANFDKLDLDDRASWAAHAASVQLPLYSLVLSRIPLLDAAALLPPEKIQGLFVMLGRNRLNPDIEFSAYRPKKRDASLEPGELARRMGLMRGLIEGLLLEISDPAVPFDPALRRQGACSECPYDVICGQNAAPAKFRKA